MKSEPFDFTAPNGRTVRARLDKPDGQARAYALFAHLFTGGKDNLAAVRIARALAGLGVGTMRLDFAGIGEAGTVIEPEGFTSDVSDLVAAAEHMGRHGCAPQLMIGHSLGGAAAIAAASHIPSVKAVATIGAPFDVAHVLKLLGPDAEKLQSGQTHETKVGGRPVRVKRAFVDDVKMQDQAERLATLKKGLLVLHAPLDEIVGIEEAAKIFAAAKHPKSFISLDHADHLLSRAADASYAASVIAAWASHYVVTDAPMEASPADGVVRVSETGMGRFQVKIEASGSVLMADEPASVGGAGAGPTPYELIGAGLGACTAMTLRLYAERKGVPLARASVEVKHTRRPGVAPVDLFERTLRLEGELTDEQRTRLFEIADKCPVHRTLQDGAAITTVGRSVADAESQSAHFKDMDEACRE